MDRKGAERRLNSRETGTFFVCPMPLTVFEDANVTSTVYLLAQVMRQGDLLRVIRPDQVKLPDVSDIPENRIIIGGSTHSVYENLPWMTPLKEFIFKIVHETEKTLGGICLGHQIILDALGGRVEKGKRIEFGIENIELTKAGRADRLFEGLPDSFGAFQTHNDVVTKLPEGAISLASTRYYPNQAVAYGNRVRTVQFHPEMNTDQYIRLAELNRDKIINQVFQGKEAAFEDHIAKAKGAQPQIDKDLREYGRAILRNFFRMAA